MLERIKQKIKQNRFLFEELVKRDFTKNTNARCWVCSGAYSAR